MRRLLVYMLILCSALSCRKDNEPAKETPAGGSWTIGGVPVKAAYSELDARKGYLLRFSDSLSANTISFLFRARPEGESSFTAAPDTSRFSNVVIRLERDGVGYQAVSGGEVSASLPQAKLYLRGTAIQLRPDQGGPELVTDFQLREF